MLKEWGHSGRISRRSILAASVGSVTTGLAGCTGILSECGPGDNELASLDSVPIGNEVSVEGEIRGDVASTSYTHYYFDENGEYNDASDLFTFDPPEEYYETLEVEGGNLHRWLSGALYDTGNGQAQLIDMPVEPGFAYMDDGTEDNLFVGIQFHNGPTNLDQNLNDGDCLSVTGILANVRTESSVRVVESIDEIDQAEEDMSFDKRPTHIIATSWDFDESGGETDDGKVEEPPSQSADCNPGDDTIADVKVNRSVSIGGTVVDIQLGDDNQDHNPYRGPPNSEDDEHPETIDRIVIDDGTGLAQVIVRPYSEVLDSIETGDCVCADGIIYDIGEQMVYLNGDVTYC